MRDLRQDNTLALVIFADSAKIPPPLGKLQSPRGLRTANGHQGWGNECKQEKRDGTGRRAKVMIRQGKEGLDRNKNCKRGKTAAKGKISGAGRVCRAGSPGTELLGLKTPSV